MAGCFHAGVFLTLFRTAIISGTAVDRKAITKDDYWNSYTCTDGTIAKDGTIIYK
jgi:hypothetical protein